MTAVEWWFVWYQRRRSAPTVAAGATSEASGDILVWVITKMMLNNTPKEILQDSRYMPHFKRWSNLRDMPSYSFAKQVKIIIATMALYNYIRRHAKRDCHFYEREDDLNGIQGEEVEIKVDAQQEDGPTTQEIKALRNHIAASLMSSSA
ncbi:hypothetical protein L3X38_037596 [Prunus dulcis]|uniref:Uncharacterized protein n=1 Tax=Prunus dulcis TaxID=3755 RepID=A0AAD4YQU5_PRUDU|nr:hypothetical protein L3X38_037596 [Prunus dulcis]